MPAKLTAQRGRPPLQREPQGLPLTAGTTLGWAEEPILRPPKGRLAAHALFQQEQDRHQQSLSLPSSRSSLPSFPR